MKEQDSMLANTLIEFDKTLTDYQIAVKIMFDFIEDNDLLDKLSERVDNQQWKYIDCDASKVASIIRGA